MSFIASRYRPACLSIGKGRASPCAVSRSVLAPARRRALRHACQGHCAPRAAHSAPPCNVRLFALFASPQPASPNTSRSGHRILRQFSASTEQSPLPPKLKIRECGYEMTRRETSSNPFEDDRWLEHAERETSFALSSVPNVNRVPWARSCFATPAIMRFTPAPMHQSWTWVGGLGQSFS